MKKFFVLILSALFLAAGCSKEFDDAPIWDAINKIDNKVKTLETLLNAQANQLTIKSFKKIDNGFHIEFSDGSSADIVNGKDGAPGKNGATGPEGPQGPQGPAGDSMIKGIEINETEGYAVITIVLNGQTQKLTFPLYKATEPSPQPEVSQLEKCGYFNVSKQYTLPQYMQVYMNMNTMGKEGYKSVVVELGEGATLANVGNTTIVEGYNAHKNEYKLFMSTSTAFAGRTMINNSTVTFAQEGIWPCFAQDADGKFDVIWYNTITEQKKIQKIGKKKEVLVDQWKPRALIPAYLMITWDGKAQSEAEAANPAGQTNTGWYGTATCARAAVGVTPEGKMLLCVTEGHGLGLTMDEISELMANIGCKAAVALEGSSSPDMIIQGNCPVKNKKRFNAEGNPTNDNGKSFTPLLVVK